MEQIFAFEIISCVQIAWLCMVFFCSWINTFTDKRFSFFFHAFAFVYPATKKKENAAYFPYCLSFAVAVVIVFGNKNYWQQITINHLTHHWKWFIHLWWKKYICELNILSFLYRFHNRQAIFVSIPFQFIASWLSCAVRYLSALLFPEKHSHVMITDTIQYMIFIHVFLGYSYEAE